MRAILFDVDGTLAKTAEADGPCFGRAYHTIFNEDPQSISWDDYAHVTDWGILDEALGTSRGRSTTLAERTAFEFAYRDAWQHYYASDPSSCTEVPGAAALMKDLIANPEIVCGVATGGTRAAAQFKLRTVGITPEKLSGAFANDAIPRTAIVRRAIRALGVSATDVVYLGDGRWDVLTCRELGLAFVGVAAESSEEMLRAEGTQSVIPDFTDREMFWDAIEHATPPSSPVADLALKGP